MLIQIVVGLAFALIQSSPCANASGYPMFASDGPEMLCDGSLEWNEGFPCDN